MILTNSMYKSKEEDILFTKELKKKKLCDKIYFIFLNFC